MYRLDDKTGFTEEDRDNLVFKEHDDTEIKANMKRHRGKYNKYRILILAGLTICILGRLLIQAKMLQFATDIAIMIFILLYIFCAINSKATSKWAKSAFYVEFTVDEILDTEVTSYVGVETSSIRTYYPILGTDTSSGYKTAFYVDKEDYYAAKPGSVITLNVLERDINEI